MARTVDGAAVVLKVHRRQTGDGATPYSAIAIGGPSAGMARLPLKSSVMAVTAEVIAGADGWNRWRGQRERNQRNLDH